MIKKIISGGQAGVERAALDVARKHYMDYGGWVPRWRAEEDDTLVKDYRLRMAPRENYVQVTEQNILDADGVLIIGKGQATGNSALNQRMAERHGRPWLHIDLDVLPAFEAAKQTEVWISKHRIGVLAVTGPKADKTLDMYQIATDILETVLQLTVIDPRRYEANPMNPIPNPADQRLEEFIRLPKTVQEAVELLLRTLTFKERTRIANMTENHLDTLMPSLGTYIRNEFRMWAGNEPLMRDCRTYAGKAGEDPATVIIKEVWTQLQRADNVLRVVK
ncbi:hypothetical protein DENIS_2334 [Desulfonema ishimotonii]|uniref:DUF6794 domain-containing protein n=1 Tax=Desulfonema ishimotonii TaxID=45657 RepID=A0A401FWR4_9BACT|nr:putative molybdenum carrier protein [Desulfonema ishimotonii]GBC61374.1 hypothetical protein DENIS_2334 [Desulfonema ishimotonii]